MPVSELDIKVVKIGEKDSDKKFVAEILPHKFTLEVVFREFQSFSKFDMVLSKAYREALREGSEYFNKN